MEVSKNARARKKYEIRNTLLLTCTKNVNIALFLLGILFYNKIKHYNIIVLNKDDIEAAYHSKLVDKGDHPLVCYHCGKELNAECHQKYIESKDIHKTVKPTCTPDHCAKRPAKKWIERSKRKVDKKWVQKNWLKRKLTVIKRREEAERNAQNE